MKLGNVHKAMLVSFILRATLVVYGSEVGSLRQSSDAFGYLRKAKELSRDPQMGFMSVFGPEGGALEYAGALVYSVTDYAPMVLGFIMAGLGTGIVYLSYRSALELWGNERSARAVAWGVTLFPQLALHSALFLKEIPVSFCLTVAAYFAIHYVKRNHINHVVGYFVAVAIAASLHSGVLVAMPALIVSMMIVRPRGGRMRSSYYATNLTAVLILLTILHFANKTSVGMEKFGGSFEAALHNFEQRELRDSAGTAGYPQWMRVRGGISDTWKVPIRFVALLYSPLLPFMIRSASHMLGALDAGLYLYLCWNIYRNWSGFKQNRAALVLFVVMFALYLLFSMGVSNFGTAIRHRAKMAPLLLIVSAGLPSLRLQAKGFFGEFSGTKLTIRRSEGW